MKEVSVPFVRRVRGAHVRTIPLNTSQEGLLWVRDRSTKVGLSYANILLVLAPY